MSDWAAYLDLKISNMDQNRRIIYFKSENRNIIEDAVDASGALQAKLGQGTSGEGSLFAHMTAHYDLIPLTWMYQAGGVAGTVKLLEGTEKDTGKKRKIVPKAVMITDYQVFGESDRSRMIKAFLDCGELQDSLMLISSPEVLIPDGFYNEIELVADQMITQNDIFERLRDRVRKEEEWRGIGQDCCLSQETIRKRAEEFVGLNGKQVDAILNAVQNQLCAALTPKSGGGDDDYEVRRLIMQERRKEAEKDPAIRFIEVDKRESVAGLGNYIQWLDERREDFADPVRARKNGTPAPKGVLLCGVPGTGKTAMARQTAMMYGVPLIQFDLSRIQNSKFGESEAKLARYLDRISAFGSCVMLMDEVEKVFSVNDSTHEVKLAMLSQLLDWMQTRKGNVLTFITANNISKLPPELLRDGRISGRFFAFMPSRNDLAAILRLKLSALSGEFFDREFKALLKKRPETEEEREKDELAGIFDRIAQEARKKQKEGENRWPFMTGANLEVLVEMTNRAIRKNWKEPFCSFKAYADEMCRCAGLDSFVPQGQSNMADIVDMWLGAQKRQYQDVSSYSLLPFSKFQDGAFTQKLTGGNEYDRFLIEVLEQEIKKVCEKEKKKEKALENYTK